LSSDSISHSDEQAIATQMSAAEALITVHQDPGNPGRVMFSIDLSGDGRDPDEVNSIPTCDLVALTLFNLALNKSEEFTATYNKVVNCITEMLDAQEGGADGDALRAIRETHGVHFRVG
jgi:hypothetical protein